MDEKVGFWVNLLFWIFLNIPTAFSVDANEQLLTGWHEFTNLLSKSQLADNGKFSPASSMQAMLPIGAGGVFGGKSGGPSSVVLGQQNCGLTGPCPAAYLNGCCHRDVRRKLDSWLADSSVADSLKQTVRLGLYGQLEPNDLSALPMFVLQRLNKDGAQFVSNSQMRAFLAKHPAEVVALANLLCHMRADYFDVFLMNLKVDLERSVEPYSNLSGREHKAIVWAARRQWGPFETWKDAQIKVASYWTSHMPCYAFYLFDEQTLVNTVLPAAVAMQSRLDECPKKSLFNRVSRSSQLTNINSWDVERTIVFAGLLAAAPPQVLKTLPQATVQHPRVLESLTGSTIQRNQAEAILSTLKNTLISPDMLVAMAGGTEGQSGKLLRYIPPTILDSQVSPNVYADSKVSTVLKSTFCKDDAERAFKTGYQIYWMYRRPAPSREWSRKDIEELGCLIRYLAPLDMARLDLFEMAKDVENSYSKTFENGDYSSIQANILFNYGRQLLHLGTGSWVAERFVAVPVSVVPGIPVEKIAEFPSDELMKNTVLEHFCRAAFTKLSLNRAQIAVLLKKLQQAPSGGLVSAMKSPAFSRCANFIQYVPYVKMQTWNAYEIFFADRSPQLSAAQAHYWLRRSMTSNTEYTTVRTLTKFLHGLDCDLISRVDLFETPALLTAIQDGQIEISPETARCLKLLLFDFLQSLADQSANDTGAAVIGATKFSSPSANFGAKNYWPSLVELAGSAVNLQLSADEMKALSLDACKSVVSTATDLKEPRKLQRNLRPRGRRESFIRAAITCVESEQRDSFQLGMAESVILKYAMSELPGDYYYKIPDEVLFRSLEYMQGGCLTNSQRRGVRAKLVSTLGATDHWREDDVSHVSCLLYELEPHEFERIPDDALVNYVQSLGSCWDDRNPETRQFRLQCEQEIGTWEALQLRERIRIVSARLALLAKRNVAVSAYNTRHIIPFPKSSNPNQNFLEKPSVAAPSHYGNGPVIDPSGGNWPDYSKMKMFAEPGPQKDQPILALGNGGNDFYWTAAYLNLTCDWLKAAGSHATSLPFETFAHPNNMSRVEFVRCIPLFGEYDWPELTRNALWDRIKREIGYPTQPELESMGTLVLSMNDQELNQLDFSQSLGLLYTFGRLDDWSESQWQLLAHRFRTTVTPVMENIDSVQLTSLGSVLCGFGQSEIEKLPVEVYVDASVAVGMLRRCSTSALRGLATLATRQDAFGPTSTWTSAALTTVGLVAAGLPTSGLSRMPARSMNGLSCGAVAAMTPVQFQAFTLEQLEYFSMDGAMCVARDHALLLNEAQRFAVWEAGSDALRMSATSASRDTKKVQNLYYLVFIGLQTTMGFLYKRYF